MNRLLATVFVVALAIQARSAEKPAAVITLEHFELVGDLGEGHAAFMLTGTARVEGRGGSLILLSGPVALTAVAQGPKWRIQSEDNGIAIRFDRGGTYPIRLQFEAAVNQSNGWNRRVGTRRYWN